MEDLLSDRWSHCKATLQQRLSAEDTAWVSPLDLVYLGPDRVVLQGVPNTFFRTRIQRHYGGLLKECLSLAFPSVPFQEAFSIELRVGGQLSPAAPEGPHEPAPGGEPPAGAGPAQNFANYLPGPHNQTALRLAGEVAAAPGQRFNPFGVVGPVGSGKTHLLRAMAARMAQNLGEARVVYRTAEAFANDVLDGIRDRRMPQVRQTYRQASALLVDDLEFLQVSGKTQTELLHTFDALQAGGGQLVFSADRHPAALAGFAAPLRSRLEAGLAAEVSLPDQPAREALAECLAARHGVTLPPGGAALLAGRIAGGPRRLEGALMRLAAYGSLQSERPTLDFLETVAAPLFDREAVAPKTPVPADRILAAVCDRFGVSQRSLTGKAQTKLITEARGAACYLLHEMGRLSFSEIGAALGNRTHSMAVKAGKRVRERIGTEPGFEETIMELRRAAAQNQDAGW